MLLNTLAPATINWHASIGASYKMRNGWELTGAYTHALDAEISGANLTPGFGQPVSLDMSQNELTLASRTRGDYFRARAHPCAGATCANREAALSTAA